ncbi:hypothetical protein [Brumimicrobium aurantiacum]|uniref:Uncharacterized protein n=1 Tax=Brumimicrobium aurantiacum TaxID=1737063 RepID=A0A3E1EUI8_9FLAO|nr:hypothetical protein [Brumimicrobium aurantiacum]RFC53217.1 hypothetical protein DXU93_14210 [Brumimicrobium aurantiacum]
MKHQTLLLLVLFLTSFNYSHSQCLKIEDVYSKNDSWNLSSQSKVIEMKELDDFEYFFIVQPKSNNRIQVFTRDSKGRNYNVAYKITLNEEVVVDKKKGKKKNSEVILYDSQMSSEPSIEIATKRMKILSIRLLLNGEEVTNFTDCVFILIEEQKL